MFFRIYSLQEGTIDIHCFNYHGDRVDGGATCLARAESLAFPAWTYTGDCKILCAQNWMIKPPSNCWRKQWSAVAWSSQENSKYRWTLWMCIYYIIISNIYIYCRTSRVLDVDELVSARTCLQKKKVLTTARKKMKVLTAQQRDQRATMPCCYQQCWRSWHWC